MLFRAFVRPEPLLSLYNLNEPIEIGALQTIVFRPIRQDFVKVAFFSIPSIAVGILTVGAETRGITH